MFMPSHITHKWSEMYDSSDKLTNIDTFISGGYSKFFKTGTKEMENNIRLQGGGSREPSVLDITIYSVAVHVLKQKQRYGWDALKCMPKTNQKTRPYLKDFIGWSNDLIIFFSDLVSHNVDNLLMMRMEMRLDNGTASIDRLLQKETFYRYFEECLPNELHLRFRF